MSSGSSSLSMAKISHSAGNFTNNMDDEHEASSSSSDGEKLRPLDR